MMVMCDFCKEIYPDEDCYDIVFGKGKYSDLNREAFITIDEDNDYHICTNSYKPYELGCVTKIIFCPYCGRKLKKGTDNMENKKPPCKDCPDRAVGCHSTCEEYIEFDKSRKEFIENRNRKNELYAHKRELITKRIKRYGRK